MTSNQCVTGGHPALTLVEVARIYNHTAQMGYPAREAVMDHLGCSEKTAKRRIQQAHRQGLIPRLQRKPSQKILDIAEALDVTPIELADAVHHIAGGHLRIENHSLTDTRFIP